MVLTTIQQKSVAAQFFADTNGDVDDATTSYDMISYGDDAVVIRRTSRGTDYKTVDLSSPNPTALAVKLRWLISLLVWTLYALARNLCWLASVPVQIIGFLQEVITESQMDREGMIPRLWVALSPQKRTLLTDHINVMSEAHIHRLKTLLARLPDKRYLEVVDLLENASSCRLGHYLAICVSTTDVSEVDNARGIHTDEHMGVPSLIERTFSKDEQHKIALHRAREWSELQDRIWRLPAELQLEIEEKLYEAAFSPGKIFPHQYPTANGRFRHSGRFYDPPAPRVLLALDRRNYAKYYRELWSGNTFIIGPGENFATTCFLSGTLPDSAIKAIRSIELRFTTKDYDGADARVDPIWGGTVAPRRVYKNEDILDIMRQYQMEADDTETELFIIWFAKLQILARHQGLEALSDLTLDFTKAYGLDGVYLGGKFCARRDLPIFWYGLPVNFTIKAPTDELKDAILARFVTVNH